jgi:hypothetical protein
MAKVIEGVRLNTPVETPGLEPAFSIQQLVRHYGNSESFWRKELGKGRLRYFKLGSLTRIRLSELERYLAEREHQHASGGGDHE